jgi:hypothetical protein
MKTKRKRENEKITSLAIQKANRGLRNEWIGRDKQRSERLSEQSKQNRKRGAKDRNVVGENG